MIGDDDHRGPSFSGDVQWVIPRTRANQRSIGGIRPGTKPCCVSIPLPLKLSDKPHEDPPMTPVFPMSSTLPDSLPAPPQPTGLYFFVDLARQYCSMAGVDALAYALAAVSGPVGDAERAPASRHHGLLLLHAILSSPVFLLSPTPVAHWPIFEHLENRLGILSVARGHCFQLSRPFASRPLFASHRQEQFITLRIST
ncbi:hypothetical protein ACMYSQ_011233 [Aspergillus niger]